MKPKTSPVWNYFVEIDVLRARCKLCDKIYSRRGRTTTALKSHLKAMHAEEYAEFEKLDEAVKSVKLLSDTKKQKVSSTPSKAVKRELPPQESLQDDHDYWDSTSEQIDHMIGEMIALHNLPFSFVEGTGFRRLMSVALPDYTLRDSHYFSSFICDNLYNRLAKKTKDLLQEFDKISFTTDMLKLCSAISLLTLMAHGISKDFSKKSIVLKCEAIDERHIGTLTSTNFQNYLGEWGIDPEKVHCMVHDCGSKPVQEMQLSGFEDVHCAIQLIQNSIQSAIESQEWLLQLTTKLKKIVTHFKCSPVAQAELKRIQKERLNQSALSVIQDCHTRWNSTFYMMERFTKLKDSLILYLSANPICIISPEDWMNISKYVQLTKPFEEVTSNLSHSQVSISSVIPLIQVLMTTLHQEETRPDTSEPFQNLARRLRDELNLTVRFGELTRDYKYTIATYLDPRYKTHFFTSISTEEIESKILSMTISRSREFRESSSTYEENEVQPTSNSSFQMLETMLSMNEDQEDLTTDNGTDNPLLETQSHLQDYKEEKRLPLHEDPLIWWKYNSHKYHNLLPLVRQYLSAPPSSVASEQLFSGDGIVYEEHRNRLFGVKAAKLLFIKYNLPLLNFEY